MINNAENDINNLKIKNKKQNVIVSHSLRFHYAFISIAFISTYTNSCNSLHILIRQICGHTGSENISFFFILIVNATKSQIKFS